MSNGSIAFDLGICSAISARLERRGVPRDCLKQAYEAAIINGTSFCDEVAHQQGVSEEMLFEAIADYLELTFTEEVLSSRIFVTGEETSAILLSPASLWCSVEMALPIFILRQLKTVSRNCGIIFVNRRTCGIVSGFARPHSSKEFCGSAIRKISLHEHMR